MARVVPLAFPVVEDQQHHREKRPEPLLPWAVQSMQIESSTNQPFPDADGSRLEEQRRRQLRELEERREKELTDQAEAVMAAAQKEGKELGYAEGREQGYAEGLEAGHSEAPLEVEQLKETLRATLEALTQARETTFAAVETDLAEIVVTLAGQLAAGAIDVEPSRVIELARQGMNLLADSDAMTIRAAEAPAALLREEQQALATALNVSSLRIVEDPTLTPEGCVVESELGRVDLRISQRLQAARDLLASVRNED